MSTAPHKLRLLLLGCASITLSLSVALTNYQPYKPMISPVQAVAGTLTLDASTSGSSSFAGDVTGASFIDKNNTSYYVDPNGATSAILNGKVGIGVVSPGYELSVEGATSPSIQVADTTSGTGATNGMVMQMVDSKGYLWNYENDTLQFGANNQTKMTIEPGGDIGIGTTNPGYLLEVNGTQRVNGALTIGDAAADTVSVNSAAWTFASDTNLTLTGGVNGLSFDGTTFSVDATNNRVGIGTAGPSYELDVTGSVRSTAVAYLNSGFDITRIADTSLQNNTTLASGIYTNLGDGLRNAAGSVDALSGWWHVINMHHLDSNGYNAQIAVPLAGAGVDPYLRTSSGGTWTEWRKLLSENTSGYVGIGNTNPHVALEVSGQTLLNRTSVIGTGTMAAEANVGLGVAVDSGNTASAILNLKQGNVASSFGEWKIASRNTSGGEFGIFNTGSNTDAMTIYGNGSASTQVAVRMSTQYSQRLCSNATDGSTNQIARLGDCLSGGSDIAEMYGSDGTLEPGDVVSIDPSRPATTVISDNAKLSSQAWVVATNTSNSDSVIGVVSTNPFAEILGSNLFNVKNHPVPIALVGRVPIKVSTANGAIKIGDPLTPSNIRGVAVKATKPGFVIGKALVNVPVQSGTVLAESFIYNTYYVPNQQSQIDDLQRQINELKKLINEQK